MTSNQNTEKMLTGGETFYANADISPFCLASVMVQNYLLLLSDADSQNWKNCKTNKVSFEICILIQRSLLLSDFDLFVFFNAQKAQNSVL